MYWVGRGLFLLFIFLFSIGFSSRAETDFYRVVYSDDRALALGLPLLELVYGAKIVVLPPSGPKPDKPEFINGLVMHTDTAQDFFWVRGIPGRDPLDQWNQVENRINEDLGLSDISDKWEEYLFLSKVAPEVKPPEMFLGSHFMELEQEASVELLSKVNEHVQKVFGQNISLDDATARSLVRLWQLREKMSLRMGKAILKSRERCHSEGVLPKTSDDWIEIYLKYLWHSRPIVERLRREGVGVGVTLEDRLFELDVPNLEGRVLEDLLVNPESVVVQKMVDIKKEIRVHVLGSSILKGGTVLRYLEFGEYLMVEERDLVERAVQEKFLDLLPERYKPFFAGADVIIEENTGKILILDLNAGLESGYFFPEEDIITTHLVAEHFRGETTPFLEEYRLFEKEPMGNSKVQMLRNILHKYSPTLDPDYDPNFWDRVLNHYYEILKVDPTSDRFEAVLRELREAGLHSSRIYYQFINHVQQTLSHQIWTSESLVRWAQLLSELEPEFQTDISDGRLDADLNDSEEKGNPTINQDSIVQTNCGASFSAL